jgi:hypothetical protein
MTFKASLDTFCKIVTIGITVFFAVVIYIQAIQVQEVGYAAPIIFSSIFIIIYLISFLYRPVAYTINRDSVTIKRLLGSKNIALTDITYVKAIERKQLRWAVRIFGVGGLFGYWGTFTNSLFGRMTWYATNLNNAVMIETKKGKRIVISPNDVDAFINQVQTKLVGSF